MPFLPATGKSLMLNRTEMFVFVCTIIIIFSCVIAVIVTVLLFVLFLHGCVDDEIKMYI